MIQKDFWLSVVKPVSQGGLLGAPYVHCGRGPESYDCWGLIVVIRERMGQPIIDEWAHIEQSQEVLYQVVLEGFSRSCWLRTSEYNPGDIVGLGKNKLMHHAGIITPWGIMHTVKSFGAIIQTPYELKLNGYRLIQPYTYVRS